MVRKKCYRNICNTKETKIYIAERFIRNLKNKIYKYITSISKNVYIDKLDYIINKYNNIYHVIIKMKPVDVKSNKYINSSKDSKFKIGDIVGTFYEKELQKTNQKKFRVEKVIKRKGDNYMSNRKLP